MSAFTPSPRKDVPLSKRLDIPPLWLALALLAAYAAHRMLPLVALPGALRWAGLALMLAALGLGVWAARGFARKDTPIHPRRKPRALLTSGAFGISRNPIYLAMVLLAGGVGLWLGSVGALVPALALLAVLDRRFVRGEEHHIRKAFRVEWDAYAERVRRWI